MRRRPVVRLALITALATSAAGFTCFGDTTGPTNPAISLSLASSALAVAQGGNASVVVTLARTDFAGDVALSATGLPAGVSAVFAPATLSGGTLTSTMTLTATASAASGSSTVVVHATGTGVTEQTASLGLTVNVAGSYALSMSPTSLSFAQGSGGNATINVNRTGGFAGAVALTVTGAPSGMTATPTPTSVTGNSSSLAITSTSTVATGSYTLTIHGTSAGTTEQTTTIGVTVTAAVTTTPISITQACMGAGTPVLWFGYQNQGGAWTHVAAASGAYTFNATNKFAIAVVQQGPNGTETMFGFFSVADVASMNGATCLSESGTIGITGTVAGLGTTDFAQVFGVDDQAFVSGGGGGTGWSMTNLPNRAMDILATRGTSTGLADKMIVRRSQTYANNAVVPALDFAATEAFAPASVTYSVAGYGSDTLYLADEILTSADTRAWLNGGPGGPTNQVYGIPSAQTVTGDMHRVIMQAEPKVASPTSWRGMNSYQRVLTNRTMTFGPVLGTPTLTNAVTSPYVRVRVQLPLQAEYNLVMGARFMQAGRSLQVMVSAGYLGTFTAWDITMPDLSAVSGWLNTWGLQSGVSTDWEVVAIGGATGDMFARTGNDGDMQLMAGQNGTIGSLLRANRLPSDGSGTGLRMQWVPTFIRR